MTNDHNAQTPPKRSRGKRVSMLIAGGVASLMAVGLIGIGGVALYGDSQKDDQGYLSTDTERFAASTHALNTENLDLDFDGVEGLVDSTSLGNIRLDVAPQNDKPVFVGIARTAELNSYLGDVAHTTLTDIDTSPFEASYSDQAGHGKPGLPADQGIWAASTQGAGPRP